MSGVHSNPLSGRSSSRRIDRSGLGGRMVVGLALLVLGGLWTLDNLRLVEAGSLIQWWPLLLLLWGLSRLVGLSGPPRMLSGAFWAVLGGILLLRPLGILSFDLGDLWPLLLIFIGAVLVYRSWRGRAFARMATDGRPVLEAFALMGGVERKVVSREFRGGDVSAVMGGVAVDLRSCALAEERAVVEVFAALGGIEIIVPEGWRVIGEVTPIMGGFEDGTALPTDPNAPVLVVRGLALMGGVEVKNSRKKNHGHVHVSRRRGPDDTVEEEIHIGPSGIHVRRGSEGDRDD